jgi:16S rRNA processing protein RimM
LPTNTKIGPVKGDKHKASMAESLRVGYVIGAHGLRGALRVKMDNPDSDILRQVQRVVLAQSRVNTPHTVFGAEPAGQGAVKLTLEGLNEVDQARALHGAVVMVAVADLPATGRDEFYYYQTLGCEVLTTAGLPLGVIEEVFFNGANDVWVVRNRSVERLVPVIQTIVKRIDFAARRVTIETVPGLLD